MQSTPSTPASTPRVLLAGFEPFENDPVNPAWEIARALDGWACEGAVVQALQLPCVFGRAIDTLDAALADILGQKAPLPLVLCIGAAGGRTEISMERAALNVDDARIPDNAGCQPIDIEVVAGGPAAYFSSLPIKAMVRDMRAAGLPAAVSNSAGTFVCNHIFYALMHRWPRSRRWRTRAGASCTCPTCPSRPRPSRAWRAWRWPRRWKPFAWQSAPRSPCAKTCARPPAACIDLALTSH
jgi:pyroglutamyl-peptidase